MFLVNAKKDETEDTKRITPSSGCERIEQLGPSRGHRKARLYLWGDSVVLDRYHVVVFAIQADSAGVIR